MILTTTRFGGNAPGLPGTTPLPSLSAALSRRAALFGAVTVVGASVAALPPAPATASAAPPISPEAAALQSELARLSKAYRMASREVGEAADRIDYPAPPDAIYERPGDRRLFLREPEPSWGDEARDWWVDPETVENLRAARFSYLDGHACPVACARRDEIVAALDGWRAAESAAEDAAGYTAAIGRFDAAADAYAAFRRRLVDMRTADPEILTVKALAIADLCRGERDWLASAIEQAIERGGPQKDALSLSLVRDFIGLMGVDRRGQA